MQTSMTSVTSLTSMLSGKYISTKQNFRLLKWRSRSEKYRGCTTLWCIHM